MQGIGEQPEGSSHQEILGCELNREILLEVEKGGKKGGIVKKYGISPSTLSTFLKQKSKIEQNIDADALGPQ